MEGLRLVDPLSGSNKSGFSQKRITANHAGGDNTAFSIDVDVYYNDECAVVVPVLDTPVVLRGSIGVQSGRNSLAPAACFQAARIADPKQWHRREESSAF
jgi:hypothetical protein